MILCYMTIAIAALPAMASFLFGVLLYRSAISA